MLSPTRILVIKLTSMGDVLFALSIVDDIKTQFPGASIDWVVDEDFAELVQSNRNIRTVFKLPLRRLSRGSGIRNWLKLSVFILCTLRKIRQLQYDVLIDMQGAIKSCIVSLFARSNRKWGYAGRHLELPVMQGIFTDQWQPSRSLPSVFQYRVFSSYALDYQPDLSKTVFQFFPSRGFETNAPGSSMEISVATVLLVPFSSKKSKQIDSQTMSEIARNIFQTGLRIAVVAGSEAERDCSFEIARLADCEIDLIFRPMENFVHFQGCLANIKLCIGVDTGIVHVSAAFGIPTIGILSTGAIEIFGPHVWAPHARSIPADQSGLVLKVSAVAKELLKIPAP